MCEHYVMSIAEEQKGPEWDISLKAANGPKI